MIIENSDVGFNMVKKDHPKSCFFHVIAWAYNWETDISSRGYSFGRD
jgi:hypothetical protein